MQLRSCTFGTCWRPTASLARSKARCRTAYAWLTSIATLDIGTITFVKGARLFYNFKDIWYGLVKAASFGAAVALAGALEGLATRGGAEGVGRAATRAVVFGCMAILVLDVFWALVLL